jgi:serine/threonine protein kinase/thioredoxin-like negative regulator of GroEL
MDNNQSMQLGKYLLLDKMAVGGMAELFRAMITGAEGFEKLVAIKKILPHMATQEEFVEAFIDEAKLAALLHHQNIVQIYDFGCLDSTYFIAMEYLFGKDLRAISQKGHKEGHPLSLDDNLFIFSQVCAGLDYAHQLKDYQGEPLNIIHRDISPPNILVTYEGSTKIVDFGIAKAATQTTMTQIGMVKGKIAYMSPEQAAGKAIDRRSDIFSCGILLYEMVTGRRMFEGDTLHILSQVKDCIFEQPEHARSDLPDDLYDILHRALQKDPGDRYQSCKEMAADVEECMYKNSMHPTTQCIAKDLKELFAEEIAAEEMTMREIASMGLPHVAEPRKAVSEQSAQQVDAEGLISRVESSEIPASERVKPSQGMSRNLWLGFGSLLGAVIALVLVFNVFMVEEKIAIVETAKPAVARPEMDKASTPSASPEPPASQVVQDVSIQAETTKFTEGMQALDEGQFAEAIIIFEELLSANPSMTEVVQPAYVQALNGQAEALLQEDTATAEELLLRAQEINPQNTESEILMGRLYMTLEDYPMALSSYQKVMEMNPKEPDAYFNAGFIYATNKEYDRAEQMYRIVTELEPPYLDEALFNLAVVQERLGKDDDCMHNLEQATAVNPDNVLAKNKLESMKSRSGGHQ